MGNKTNLKIIEFTIFYLDILTIFMHLRRIFSCRWWGVSSSLSRTHAHKTHTHTHTDTDTDTHRHTQTQTHTHTQTHTDTHRHTHTHTHTHITHTVLLSKGDKAGVSKEFPGANDNFPGPNENHLSYMLPSTSILPLLTHRKTYTHKHTYTHTYKPDKGYLSGPMLEVLFVIRYMRICERRRFLRIIRLIFLFEKHCMLYIIKPLQRVFETSHVQCRVNRWPLGCVSYISYSKYSRRDRILGVLQQGGSSGRQSRSKVRSMEIRVLAILIFD